MEPYDPQAIETKWQAAWEEARAFNTPNTGNADGLDFSLLEMLPYPSGTLHVGQVRNYTQGDVLTHFHRRNGRRVMRPMGYDSFGLNAENAAISSEVSWRVPPSSDMKAGLNASILFLSPRQCSGSFPMIPRKDCVVIGPFIG